MPIITALAVNAGLVLASVPVLVFAGLILVHARAKLIQFLGAAMFGGAVLAIVLFIALSPYAAGGS